MRVFVTGFGPFGQVKENPSSILAQDSGYPHAILEVSYEAVDRFLEREFPRDSFDALLMLGVSGRAKTMQLEMFGANACQSHPDVLGVSGKPIIEPGGPAWRETTLWERHHQCPQGFRRSSSAGRYLCNYSLYQGLRWLPSHKVGFVHVPTALTLALDEQLKRLKALLRDLSG